MQLDIRNAFKVFECDVSYEQKHSSSHTQPEKWTFPPLTFRQHKRLRQQKNSNINKSQYKSNRGPAWLVGAGPLTTRICPNSRIMIGPIIIL